MKALRVIGIAVLLTALAISIWLGYERWQERVRRAAEPTVATEPVESAGPELVVTSDPEQVEVEAFRKEVRALALARNWDALEARAEELRKSKARFSGGSWQIRHFYESINPFESVRPWMQASREWVAEKPQSVTAHVAHADALLKYAWAARGDTDAKKMSPEVAKLFQDQLDEAWGVLEKARTLPEKDPYWWHVALTPGFAFERDLYDQLFEEAVAFEPEFLSYYLHKARYLLPRWHGKEGEWERFAEEAAQKSPGPGKEVYARIVTDISGIHQNQSGETSDSWELTKAGFEEILEKYPESLYWRSVFGVFACRHKDREVARNVFEELKGRVVLNVWRTAAAFIECRDWALAGSNTR